MSEAEIEDRAASEAEIRKRNLFGLPQFGKQLVITEAKEQREQNEGSEVHLKTKRFGWIGGLGSTFTFAIEWFGG